MDNILPILQLVLILVLYMLKINFYIKACNHEYNLEYNYIFLVLAIALHKANSSNYKRKWQILSKSTNFTPSFESFKNETAKKQLKYSNIILYLMYLFFVILLLIVAFKG
jgi:hypothetical protein